VNKEGKFFGFWKASELDSEELPWVHDFTDENWNPKDKERLLAYIYNCPLVIVSGSIRTKCLLCDDELASSDFVSDGEWLWPKDLTHYMMKHFVRLPDKFIEHIRKMNYDCPSEIFVDWRELPWPE